MPGRGSCIEIYWERGQLAGLPFHILKIMTISSYRTDSWKQKNLPTRPSTGVQQIF
jgi:hypothetical protein